MPNPAYVRWVEMVKGTEKTLVHPGNVNNYLRFGWKRAPLSPAPLAVDITTDAHTSLTLPELTVVIAAHEQAEAVAAETETESEPEDDGLQSLAKPPRKPRKPKKDA
jgi:hypothetical protein